MLLLLSPLLSTSGGFQVRLQHQRNNGIGLIGTPFLWGAGSIFYNPGALAKLDNKMYLCGGVSPIFPYVSFQQDGSNVTYHNESMIGYPVYLYYAAKITPRITAGIGLYTPYGSSLQYESNWVGRNVIQSISLMAYFIQPTISYKINDKLGVGAGLVYAFGVFDIDRGLTYSEDSYVNLNGSSSNIGFNVGVHYSVNDKINIGIDYRSKITMDLKDGKATFYVPESVYSIIPKNNTFTSTLPLPANLDIGVSYQITPRLLLAAEVDWIQWSAYKNLSFTFKQKGDLLDESFPRKYRDIITPRLGAEYKVASNFLVRAGIYYDQSPVNSNYFTPETVSLNSIGTTVGISYSPIHQLDIDLSFGQLFSFKSSKRYQPADFNGTYKTNISSPGIGISYRF